MIVTFQNLNADEVLERVRTHWNLDGPVPTPTAGWLACPVCRSEVVQARWWRFHHRRTTKARRPSIPYRCDVSFKCCDCSAVWDHGVVVDKAMFDRPRPIRNGAPIPWRDAHQWLTERPDDG